MPYDPNRHHRRSIRLKGYDYTQPGAYFITIVTYERMPLFGDIMDGEMRLNDIGRVAERCWIDIPSHFPHVELDVFVIMPTHVHGILWIVDADTVGAKNFSPLPSSPVSSPPSSSPVSPLPPSSSPSSPTERPRGISKTIGSIVRGFKIGVTQWVRQNTDVHTVWQRNYYEHIIRNEYDLNTIRRYILENPLRWHLDYENPARTGSDPLAQAIQSVFRQDNADRPTGGDT